MMILAGYNVRKAAQVAAFYALNAGGEINVLKLTKLIYLSDRKFLEKYDSPILLDKLVSMPHGPVNSITNNYINGELESADWDAFIADRSGYNIAVATADISVNDLDELSDAELAVLNETWSEFGHMSKYTIRDYTHTHCPEWNDPKGSSVPIEYETVFKFLGKKDSAALAEAIEEERRISTAWGDECRPS